jgi:hypothetical protein
MAPGLPYHRCRNCSTAPTPVDLTRSDLHSHISRTVAIDESNNNIMLISILCSTQILDGTLL